MSHGHTQLQVQIALGKCQLVKEINHEADIFERWKLDAPVESERNFPYFGLIRCVLVGSNTPMSRLYFKTKLFAPSCVDCTVFNFPKLYGSSLTQSRWRDTLTTFSLCVDFEDPDVDYIDSKPLAGFLMRLQICRSYSSSESV